MHGPQDKARFRAAFERLELVWPLPRRITERQPGDNEENNPSLRRQRFFLLHYRALEQFSVEAVEAAERKLIERSRGSGDTAFFPKPGEWRELAQSFEASRPTVRLLPAAIDAGELESRHRGYIAFLEACKEHGFAGAALLTPAPPDTLEDARHTSCSRGEPKQLTVGSRRMLTAGVTD